MNKTDIKVKKSGKCMFLCGENGKVNEDARKSSIKMEKDSYKIRRKKRGLMKSEVNAKQSKFKKNIPLYVLLLPSIIFY